MRVPCTPVFAVPDRWATPDVIAEIQADINKYYKGVEAEIVTDSKGHGLTMYVDGIEVAAQGLAAAMQKRPMGATLDQPFVAVAVNSAVAN